MSPETTKRRRSPEANQAAILQAARATLNERGYARASIREIARRAGVTPGLVMARFGNKEQLVLAALTAPLAIVEAIEGDARSLPERVAHTFVDRMESSASSDPFVAVIRSVATDEDVAYPLYEEMFARTLAAYDAVVEVDDLAERVDLIRAQIIGITFCRYVVKRDPLARMSPDRLETYLAGIIRGILQLPSPTA